LKSLVFYSNTRDVKGCKFLKIRLALGLSVIAQTLFAFSFGSIFLKDGRVLYLNEELGHGAFARVFASGFSPPPFDSSLAVKVFNHRNEAQLALASLKTLERLENSPWKDLFVLPTQEEGVWTPDFIEEEVYFQILPLMQGTVAQLMSEISLGETSHKMEGDEVLSRVEKLMLVFVAALKMGMVLEFEGVRHRDISPQNILYKVDFHQQHFFKLNDADHAVAADKAEHYQFQGNPNYMAPEVTRLKSYTELSAAADYFSIAASLFHLMTGRPLARFTSEMDYLTKAITPKFWPPLLKKATEEVTKKEGAFPARIYSDYEKRDALAEWFKDYKDFMLAALVEDPQVRLKQIQKTPVYRRFKDAYFGVKRRTWGQCVGSLIRGDWLRRSNPQH